MEKRFDSILVSGYAERNVKDFMLRQRRQHQGSTNRPAHARATDQEIKKWVLRQHGFVPESAWIEYCKRLFGVSPTSDEVSENSCPLDKLPAMKQAFRAIGLLSNTNEPSA